jgi:hypothetical protein
VGEKLQEMVSVLDYVPVAEHAAILQGTSTYDASTAFQNAAATGRGVFVPGRKYVIGTRIDLGTCPGLFGEGGNPGGPGTMIVAVASPPLAAMFDVKAGQTQIRNLHLNCNNQSACGLRVNGGNSSVFDNLTIDSATRDGILFSPTGNNNVCRVANCMIRYAGHAYDEGTASNGAGGTTVTVAGAADLTTLGIRPELDLVRVGASPAATITAVTATTLTTSNAIASANSNATYQILIGHGVAIPAHGNNSTIVVEKTTFQHCMASGLRDNGLYGARARDNVYEFNGIGRIIGVRGEGSNIGAVEEHGYFEGSQAGAHILLDSSIDATIRPAVGGIEDIYIPAIATTRGTIIEASGIRAEGQVHSIVNYPTVAIEFGNTYHFQYSAAAAHPTLNLPALNAAPMTKYLLGNMEAKIVLVFMDVGGRTFTIKAPDLPVNGVPGTTGITHTGNYSKREIRLDPGTGWVVTG